MAELESTSIVGARLKKAREQKGISIEEASFMTKIHKSVIEDIESDKLYKRLNELYVRSFLKRYSEFLDLNPQEIIDEYVSVHTAGENKPSLHIGVQKLTSNWIERMPRFSKPIVIVLLGCLFIYFTYSVGLRGLRESMDRFKAAQAKKVRKVEKTKNSSALKKDSRQSTEFVKEAEPVFPISKNESLLLDIQAKENCWMQIKADGQVVFQGILTEGAREKWQASKAFELWLGNPGGLDTFLNSSSLSDYVRSGRIIKGMKITHEGVTK